MNLEGLESRRMFVADGTAAINGAGIVEAAGTTGPDTIVVQATNNNTTLEVTINGTPFDFIYADVVSLSILTSSGDDSVTLVGLNAETGRHTAPAAYVNAGDGNDTLIGADGNDTLTGAQGNDSINGGGGDDLLNGLGTSDTIFGGQGNDKINGGDGKDLLYGDGGPTDFVDGGNDTISGGANVDYLFGEDGNDSLIGGGGNDRLDGGFDNDYMEGSAGNDQFFAQDFLRDTIVGNGGADIALDVDIPVDKLFSVEFFPTTPN
jgi:Ca2+-binding RTX toxin-like protein